MRILLDMISSPSANHDRYDQQTAERIYAVIKHPAATGVTSAYFHEAGQHIRRALTSSVPKNRV